MALSCFGVIFLDVSNYTMGALAYSLGIGMGSTMVAVRKAYAGSYSKLLAMQKVAEVSIPTVIFFWLEAHPLQVLPAVLIATAGELTNMWTSVGLCIGAALLFGLVRRREKQYFRTIEQERVY